MIKLKIIYFGMIAEATGLQQEELIFSENLLEMLDRALQKKYPQIATLNYQFAVNKNIERMLCQILGVQPIVCQGQVSVSFFSISLAPSMAVRCNAILTAIAAHGIIAPPELDSGDP